VIWAKVDLLFAWFPEESTETLRIWPVDAFFTKISAAPFVSPGMRSDAGEWNATRGPAESVVTEALWAGPED
jgi:hypothetical protein